MVLRPSFLNDVKWGTLRGILGAMLLSVAVASLDSASGGRNVGRVGADVESVVLVYLASGAIAGALVGAARPYLVSWPIAVLVGISAAWPFTFLSFLMSSETSVIRELVVDSTALSVAYGVALSFALRRVGRESRHESSGGSAR